MYTEALTKYQYLFRIPSKYVDYCTKRFVPSFENILPPESVKAISDAVLTGSNLLLQSNNPGSGKTCAAVCAGTFKSLNAVGNVITPYAPNFLPFTSIPNTLVKSDEDKAYGDMLHTILSDKTHTIPIYGQEQDPTAPKYLIIDDIKTSDDPNTLSHEVDSLSSLVEKCYNYDKPFIITTNMTGIAMQQRFGKAILSRILNTTGNRATVVVKFPIVDLRVPQTV